MSLSSKSNITSRQIKTCFNSQNAQHNPCFSQKYSICPQKNRCHLSLLKSRREKNETRFSSTELGCSSSSFIQFRLFRTQKNDCRPILENSSDFTASARRPIINVDYLGGGPFSLGGKLGICGFGGTENGGVFSEDRMFGFRGLKKVVVKSITEYLMYR